MIYQKRLRSCKRSIAKAIKTHCSIKKKVESMCKIEAILTRIVESLDTELEKHLRALESETKSKFDELRVCKWFDYRINCAGCEGGEREASPKRAQTAC